MGGRKDRYIGADYVLAVAVPHLVVGRNEEPSVSSAERDYVRVRHVPQGLVRLVSKPVMESLNGEPGG